MENQQTPDAWVIGTCGKDECVAGTKGAIAILPVHFPYGKNAEENAKLMAAAPDLLEALRDLLNVDHSAVDIQARIDAEAKAQAAIAKATG